MIIGVLRIHENFNGGQDSVYNSFFSICSLSLSLDPLASPNNTLPTDDTFHTASSSPKTFPSSNPRTPSTEVSAGAGGDTPIQPKPKFRLGPAPSGDDSDDMSSTEDYHKVLPHNITPYDIALVI